MKRIGMILCLASGMAAANPAPEAFSLHLPIEMPADASLVSLRLPADVYRVLRRPDMGDVRILNGAGEAVPMALLPMRTDVRDERRELPLVPLPTHNMAMDPARFADAQGAGHAYVEIAGEKVVVVTIMPGYLLDLGEAGDAIDALELSWEGTPEFEAALDVRASDDLSSWHTVSERAMLLATGTGATRVEHRRIALPSVRARYLRLEWRGTLPPRVRLTGATLVHPQRTALPSREWIDLPGERSGDVVRYVSPGLFPVDALTVVPTNPADVLSASVESRPDPTQRWTARGRVQAYRLTQDGKTIEAAPDEIRQTRDPLWQLRFTGSAPTGDLPALRLGWRPDMVVFVARGAGPFQLVAGNERASAAWQAVRTVVPGYGTHGEVPATPARIGTVEATVAAAPRAEAPWQQSSQWLLWGALLLGVGVLGMMARGLMRELSSGDGVDKP